MITFDATIQQRRDTAANWTAANPTLANGEFGYETDTGKLKVGDGATAWNALPYFSAGGGGASIIISAGTLSQSRSDVTFSNSNGVSFGLSTNGVITATVFTNYQSTGAYLTTAMASNRGSDFVQATAAFAGTNASGTINSTGISVSVAAPTAQSINVSAGTTSNNLTAVTFSNSNNVSFGLNASTLTASIATTYAGTGLTTATTAGTNVVGTLNTSGLSLGVPAFLTTAMQSNAATISNVNVSAGTTSTNASAFTFSNANNVSFGLGTGASAGNVTASIATTYAGTGVTTATTAGTAVVGTLNTSGLSLGVPAYITTADLSQNSSKYAGTAFTTTTSAGAVIAGTLNTSGLTLGVPAFLTTAMASNAATISNINISAGTTSTNASAFTFSNSNAFSFGLGTGTAAGIVTASYTVPSVTNSSLTLSDAATSMTIGRLAFTNSNGLTLTLSTTTGGSATLIGSYTVPTVTNSSWTVSDNATSGTVGRLAFTNINGVTLSLSSGTGGLHTIVGSVATSLTNINVSAGTTSNNLSAIVFSNSNFISFGLSGSTITASVEGFRSYWNNLPFAGMGGMTVAQSTSYICPFWLPYYVSASYIRLPASFSIAVASMGTTANTTFSASILSTINAVVYSLGTGASSNSLQSVASGSAPFAQQWSWQAGTAGSQWSVTEKITYPTRGATSQFTTSDFNSTSNISIQSSQLTGFNSFRYLDIPFANSLVPGAYWLMVGVSSTTSTQGNANGTSQIISCSTQIVTQSNVAMGDLVGSVVGSQAFQLGIGSFTTNAIGTTASLDLSNVTRSANVPLWHIQFVRQV